MLNIKRMIAGIFIFAMIFVMADFSYADNSNQAQKVEQKRLQIRNKINSLRKLERQETNKLTRNQQKLEKNQKTIKTSQEKLKSKQTNIVKLQKELDTYLKEYNVRQKSTAERIRCIYKTNHTMILDLLLSADNISDFLDRIYYQNLIIQSDKKKMKNLKTEAQNIALLKRRLEYEKYQLSGLIKTIDKENASIQTTIKINQ